MFNQHFMYWTFSDEELGQESLTEGEGPVQLTSLYYLI